MTDDWKGEGLIRKVERSSPSGIGTRLRMGTHQRTAAKDKAAGRKPIKQWWNREPAMPTVEREFCSTSGCMEVLRPENVSGKCRHHVHNEGCRCIRCRPLPT